MGNMGEKNAWNLGFVLVCMYLDVLSPIFGFQSKFINTYQSKINFFLAKKNGTDKKILHEIDSFLVWKILVRSQKLIGVWDKWKRDCLDFNTWVEKWPFQPETI